MDYTDVTFWTHLINVIYIRDVNVDALSLSRYVKKTQDTTVSTAHSSRVACNRSVSTSFPLPTYYEVTAAEVLEPCFSLTGNDSNSRAKSKVCSYGQTGLYRMDVQLTVCTAKSLVPIDFGLNFCPVKKKKTIKLDWKTTLSFRRWVFGVFFIYETGFKKVHANIKNVGSVFLASNWSTPRIIFFSNIVSKIFL